MQIFKCDNRQPKNFLKHFLKIASAYILRAKVFKNLALKWLIHKEGLSFLYFYRDPKFNSFPGWIFFKFFFYIRKNIAWSALDGELCRMFFRTPIISRYYWCITLVKTIFFSGKFLVEGPSAHWAIETKWTI